MPQEASILEDIKASLPYPVISMPSELSFERIVATGLAAKLNLISDGFGVGLSSISLICHMLPSQQDL